MQVFQRLRPFAAISFDLDDTLYDNGPIIRQAEAGLLAFLHQEYPNSRSWLASDWRHLRLQLMAVEPTLAHDPTAARRRCLRLGLERLGYGSEEAQSGSEAAMAEFLRCRSDFRVSDQVLDLLERLSQRWPLIGLSNGNVNPKLIGLGQALEFVLQAGQGVRMKPFPDMFELACERLGISVSQLLHVGDSLSADVTGARRAGCQSVWLQLPQASPLAAPVLPTMTIHDLYQLQAMLT
ncbi:HAD-IA family hydrolase [Shewanella sedimentimangrovi]|uniref:HAD-IA family hydrolase n=1 Tax=Shewanella sedimentimangrovi TaxID=2814293 RepID=A0ABX7QZF5_9GAMM|nr:HAD-IA family hydrolase [Shewanella sedimentimangrovi]QSX36927.1 HAD-IA family hydrolase [Shewanella sedimentimangrovi]